MRFRKMAISVISATALLSTATVWGHHGRAAYGNVDVTVAATVVEFKFVNPHVQVYFDVTDESGEIQHWQGEMTAPNKMARGGWTKQTLKPDDKIQITGRLARNGAHSVVINEIIMPNGENIPLWEVLN
jgi:hypothetical protein